MIVVPCDQGSIEWHAARCSVPTASCFDRLLTPAKLEPSKSAGKYLHECLAGWLFGPSDDGSAGLGGFVARGTDMEAEAAADFAFRHGVELERAPFFLRDDRLAGASPDYLVGEDELVEFKVPSAAVHLGYLLGGIELDGAYRLQLQGQLYITERRRVTICSYHPVLPPVEVVVDRDEAVIRPLAHALDAFAGHLIVARARLLEIGMVPWGGSAAT